MKKSVLQKPIKVALFARGFEHVKGDNYAIISGDNTKFILRIPDGNKGFILGAQFSDIGMFDGALAHSEMQQYDHAYELAYGKIKEYTEDEIISATEQVLSDYEPYFQNGADEIGRRIDEWTFGDLDERVRDRLLRYFGKPGIEPYSDEYLVKTVEEHANGGMLILTEEEYSFHRSFYDRYKEHGAEIATNDKSGEVLIKFSAERKWYQQ